MDNSVARLSHLNLQLHQPAAPLRPYIKSYWFISASDETAHKTEYLPCDTGCGITFNFRTAMLMGAVELRQDCLISGPNTTSVPLQLGQHADAIGIHFHPGMAYPFIQEPLTEFITPIEPTADLRHRLELNRIYDELAASNLTSVRIALLDNWFLHLLQRAPGVSSELSNALNWLDWQSLQPISTLSQQISLSQRQLERMFKQWVGISPKHYSRLLRVNHARATLRNGSGTVRLSDAALNAGYFDQAHFNREFKQVVGLTPGQYLKCLGRTARR